MIANCRITVEHLGPLEDGTLDRVEAEALRQHLAICPRCTEFLESYRGTSRVLRDATRVDVPDDVARRLRAALRARGLLPEP